MNVSCPFCGDGISYPNKFIFNILVQIEDKLDFLEREYKPSWCKFLLKDKQKRGYYDIFIGINGDKYIIEMDGGFHNRTFDESKYTINELRFIDKEKDRLAIENGTKVIRIDCDYNDEDKYDYIKNNLMVSELNDLIDFNLIDFDLANINSQKSLLLECCKLWNDGFKASEIIEKTKINKCTISTYLKKGNKYGFCKDYSSTESNRRSSAKQIVCLNNKEVYITISEASAKYNINEKSIIDCCKGKDFSAGKDPNTKERLFWMYKSDYDQLNEIQITDYLLNKKIDNYKNNIHGKAVICITTNEIFETIMDGSRAHNISDSGIRKCCKELRGSSGQLEDGTRLKWMFLNEYLELNNMFIEELVKNNSSIFMSVNKND